MSGKSMVTIGFLSLAITTGVVPAIDSFASDTSRTDIGERIGHGGSTYLSRSLKASDCRVVGEERIGHGGATYQLQSGQAGECLLARANGKKEYVTKRIGHGGAVYSSSQTVTN